MHALHAASDGAEVLSTDARQRGRQPDGFGSDPRPQIGAKIAHRPQTARCRIRSEALTDPTASDAGLPIAGYAASWLAAHDRARPAFTAAAAVLFAGAPAALVTVAGNSLLVPAWSIAATRRRTARSSWRRWAGAFVRIGAKAVFARVR